MKTARISVMGIPVSIGYDISNTNMVEWHVNSETSDTQLLDTLLRHHHTAMIESELLQIAYYESYTQGMMPDPSLDIIPTEPF